MILNQTTGKILSKQEIVCNTPFSRMWGLMFRKKQNCLIIFPEERIISLHMFFVFYPIDVVIANKNGKIVEIKHNFKPFTVWTSAKAGKYVLELAEPASVKVGEKIRLKTN